MKNAQTSSTTSNPEFSLENLKPVDGKLLFPEKLKRANEFLEKHPFPKELLPQR
ncbi:hypothetical protein [Dyadobacter sandarakinus]|uniref:Uncharacterized protein n=1 Tax=Dyadobacter sandarakinus TaxID=2747268 RepID=A0ABX7I8S4_9BACT|nr:hypothetical protein [Dyadobacter sandarakinus]QRR02360.1 hypothetical protein HWI92_16305 [Dyadobacter sandarakinus]